MAEIKKIELKIPDLGEAESTEIIEVNIQKGAEININDPLVVLESEKAAMEVPSDHQGKIIEVLVKEGDSVEKDQVFAIIESQNEEIDYENDKDDEAPKSFQPKQTESDAREVYKIKNQINNAGINAGPAVRKYARELEIKLSEINGTGRNGKITKEDLKRFIHSASRGSKDYIEFTEKDFSDFKDYSIENQTKIEEISANNLHRSWISIPHVTHQEEADVTNLKDNLKKNGISLLALLVEASAKALKEYRKFNSSLVDKNQILYKKEVNIGIAVDTPNGLVVPVIKNADQLDSKEITQSISILAEKSRNKKLLVDDMKSATFTISSLGKIGGTGFSPIINPPEVAILGVSRTKTSLFLENNNVIEREIMPFSLSYDHRVINGAHAGKFTYYIKEFLEKYYD